MRRSSLAAITLAGAAFDWLRHSSLRFAGDPSERAGVAASLEASYLGVMALLAVGRRRRGHERASRSG